MAVLEMSSGEDVNEVDREDSDLVEVTVTTVVDATFNGSMPSSTRLQVSMYHCCNKVRSSGWGHSSMQRVLGVVYKAARAEL